MHRLARLSIIVSLLAPFSAPARAQDDDLPQRAWRLAHDLPIVDGHIDAPTRMHSLHEDLSHKTGGQFDYPRAVAGGLDAPFMSIYVPATYQDQPDKAKAHAEALIDLVDALIARAPDKFAAVRRASDIENNFQAGLISLPMGIENGAALEGDLANLDHFYHRGVRYITLTHSAANRIGDSSYSDKHPWGGLSPFGEAVVQRMNALGIMVDVSHVSDATCRDVLAVSAAPVIASHSSARHFTPGWERNLSDDLIRAIAAKDGVVMINFGSWFLTDAARRATDAFRPAFVALLHQQDVGYQSEAAEAFIRQYRAEHPYPFASLSDVLDHIDYIKRLVGVDHIGLGSDFEGLGDTLPVDIKDVAAYPNLVAGLLERGYSEAAIAKILSGNLLRVWRAVEAHAHSAESR